VRDASVYKPLPAIPDTSPGATRSAGGRDSGKPFTAQDVRFTLKGNTLYAFVMGWPEREAVIQSLASAGKVANVELLGFKGKLQWSQDAAGLKVAMPAEKPCEHAIVLKIVVG
jgi:alpha-L-fucosidase